MQLRECEELLVLQHLWGENAYAQAKAQVEALTAGPYPELRQVRLQ